MCDPTIISWFSDLTKENPLSFYDKSIIEVGSKDFNGTVRKVVTNQGRPKSYIGVDIVAGENVDKIVSAENLEKEFGPNSFDIVICTEMLEHVYDWRVVLKNLKSILKANGKIYLSTRSFGFPYHGYPFDFWRYSPEDIKCLFSDFVIEYLFYDSETIGVSVIATKPCNWKISDLQHEVYSIATGAKIALPQNITLFRRFLAYIEIFLPKIIFRIMLLRSVTGMVSIDTYNCAFDGYSLRRPFLKKIRLCLLRMGILI